MTPFKHSIFWSLVITLLVSCAPESNKEKAKVTALDYDVLGTDNFNDFVEPQTKSWQIAGGVYMNRLVSNEVTPQEGKGVLLNMQANGKDETITTKLHHGDIDLQLEFMLSPGAGSNIYFQGMYALQLADSWKKDSVSVTDCGVIIQSGPVKNTRVAVPLINACKAPGLWQHLFVSFKAPRFDSAGKKISNAWFERVALNGKTIQEHVEVNGASDETLGSEKSLGPLVFQGGKGAVAFRNIRYKSYDEKRITLTGMQYQEYKGTYRNYDTLKNFTPIKTGKTDSLSFRLIEKKINWS